MRWIIGNGHNIKFWTFNWICDFPLIHLVDDTSRASIDLDESVSDYLVNGVWNIEKLSHYLESSIHNDVLFRDSGFSPASVVHASASFCAAYRTHNPRSVTTSNSLSEVIKWHPPPENFVKLNFDGSVSSSNLAAAGFVIRNHFGDPIVAGSRSIGSSTIPLAEGTALKDGLLAAKRFNLDHILVDGDSSLIINCVNLKCEAPWMLKSLLQDIASIANSFASISFSHVLREANFLAVAVTSMGSGSSPRVWLQCLPILALRALYWDKFSFGCLRGFSL
ncbi:uncharacterized protein LOC112163988 [Rosa chinensis]|uniref:uncharacterized protein LOC112163988 n=1 Tax=Rosa chinensis TaxID=74649 RepID=UPI000D094FB5|nr:uncharacterized protein LOC112163988 [Rosa chinensis]